MTAKKNQPEAVGPRKIIDESRVFWKIFGCVLAFSILGIVLYDIHITHQEKRGVYLQKNCMVAFPHHPALQNECMTGNWPGFRERGASLPAPLLPVARPGDMPSPLVDALPDNQWSPHSMDMLNTIRDALRIIRGYERAAMQHAFFTPDESHADLLAVQHAIDAGKTLGRRMGKEMAWLKLEEYGNVPRGTLPVERLHYLLWVLEKGKDYIEPVAAGQYYLCGVLDNRSDACLWDIIDTGYALHVGELVAECGQWEDRDTSAPCDEVTLLENTTLTTIEQLEYLSSVLRMRTWE